MDSYTTIWTNQNDNYSCIDPAFLPYNLIEQNPRKDLSNKMLNTALSGQMKKEEHEAVALRRRQVEAEAIRQRNEELRKKYTSFKKEAEQTATKDDQTGRARNDVHKEEKIEYRK
ncbi:unnamed protein product [Rotaria sp. Silwood2]|nr:unnamed protein product [Rotaria sp. Silwood2]CAF4029368.1 unnamed protein product [Rotaria sp. Silwood2]